MLNARKILLDKLIEDLTDLIKQSPDPSGVVFAEVSKFYYDFPKNKPALMIRNSDTFPQQQNLGFDEMRIGFEAIIYDNIQAGKSQEDYDNKIDRLTSAEWYLYEYLAKIPDNIGSIDGVTVYAVVPTKTAYREIDAPDGLGIVCSVGFEILVNIDVHLLSSDLATSNSS